MAETVVSKSNKFRKGEYRLINYYKILPFSNICLYQNNRTNLGKTWIEICNRNIGISPQNQDLSIPNRGAQLDLLGISIR